MNEMRDFDKFKGSLRDFEWIRDVAPGATDLDLVIEKRGHFLVLEDKTWSERGVSVPLGQHIMFEALAHPKSVTRMLVGTRRLPSGEVDADDPFRVVPYGTYTPYDRGAHRVFPPGVFERADFDDMRQLVRTWMRKVER